METNALKRSLQGSTVFSMLPAAERERMVQLASAVRLQPRQHLFEMGSPADCYYVIKAGTLSLYRPSYSGDHKVFRTLGSGDLVAETVMFLDKPEYPLSAEAVTAVSCFRLPRSTLLQISRTYPEFTLALMSGMALSMSQSLNRIDLLTISNSAQRLVLYLMDLHMQQRRAWLDLPGSRHVVARQLNITPETLSRQLSGFKRAGFIGTKGTRQLVLLDAAALCAAVELPPPQLEEWHMRPVRQLGKSLFDCCNISKP
ncbi:MAG: Crp/Fnr family transcriptional regulator [Oceanisphaera sp.]